MYKNKKIEQPYFTDKPEVGDIFFGESEFIIGRFKDETEDIVQVGFINEDDCYYNKEFIEKIYSKGKVFQFSTTRKVESKLIDESRKSAIWCVESIKYTKSLKLLYSTLPEIYLVKARRMINNKYNENGELIEFYTHNAGQNVVWKNLEVIGKLIKE